MKTIMDIMAVPAATATARRTKFDSVARAHTVLYARKNASDTKIGIGS